jgi:hypothetical protein
MIVLWVKGKCQGIRTTGAASSEFSEIIILFLGLAELLFRFAVAARLPSIANE